MTQDGNDTGEVSAEQLRERISAYKEAQERALLVPFIWFGGASLAFMVAHYSFLGDHVTHPRLILLCILAVLLAATFWWHRRLSSARDKSGLTCPHCRTHWREDRHQKVLVATGHCPVCGKQIAADIVAAPEGQARVPNRLTVCKADLQELFWQYDRKGGHIYGLSAVAYLVALFGSIFAYAHIVGPAGAESLFHRIIGLGMLFGGLFLFVVLLKRMDGWLSKKSGLACPSCQKSWLGCKKTLMLIGKCPYCGIPLADGRAAGHE